MTYAYFGTSRFVADTVIQYIGSMNPVRKVQTSVKPSQCLAIAWTVGLMIVFGASWFKAAENERDLHSQAVWQSRQTMLQAESNKEYKRLEDLLRSTFTTPLTRSELESELNDGHPFKLQPNESRQDAHFELHKYGISIALSF